MSNTGNSLEKISSREIDPAGGVDAALAEREPEPIMLARANVRRSRRKWLVGLLLLLLAGLIAAFMLWYTRRPIAVSVVNPQSAAITETIASSGRVGGATETAVGSQVQGVVQSLAVKEGDRVTSGQSLAVLKNDVAEAQVAQAEQAVRTARAQLDQTSRGPLGSDVEAAQEQVRQAEAQVAQQRAAVTQAERSVDQAWAQLAQLIAERDLAASEARRSAALAKDGIIPRAEDDKLQTALRVAEQRVEAQRESIELGEANVRQAQAGLKAAEANVRSRRASLATVKSGARSEDIQVARQRLNESERALEVARRQAGNAVVTAPFDGVVTKINAEVGQTVGSQGVLQLVSSDAEIRLDVDENNLAELQIGQTAVISSPTFAERSFEGTVTELGAAVDVSRGTIEVTVVPRDPPDWLRPGQTVNVNIVTAKDVRRLLIPQTAVARVSDRTVVYVVEDGAAKEKVVATRPPTADGVPVLAGLEEKDAVIVNAGDVTAGASVRVRREGEQ
ncbi:MAG: efflux RND transporter periplasmic adaptor subunit [Chloracidobacterium sp.]|nr:efflux RND transporter periplasmic adaptor subunit [Chloracidobacterium sp.]